jgi:nitronate monooxygenase
MLMKSNAFCQLVGVSRPLQQASMTRVTTPALVAAVSNAGALGMMAVGRSPAAAVMQQLEELRALTNKPFGAGFIVRFLSRETLEAVAEQVKVIEFFYDWPDASLVLPGTITGWQVGTVDEAKAAVDAGCAFVIAQGVEAGGHVRSTVPFNVLIDAVRNAVDIPIVAAGGIGTAADVRAAFALGADAVRIGTRFLGSTEADIHPQYLDLLIQAVADDAQYTELFAVGWPDAPQRVLASAVAAATVDDPDPVGFLGDNGLPRRGTTPPVRKTTGQIEAMALYAGRSVGALTKVQPAAEIIDELLAAAPDVTNNCANSDNTANSANIENADLSAP